MPEVTFGGRQFTVVRFDQENGRWAMTPVQRAIFLSAWQKAAAHTVVPVDGEETAAWWIRMQEHLSATPRNVDIAAALLLPEGVEPRKFSRKVADETTQFLSGIADADEAVQILQVALDGAQDFFLHGAAQLRRSRSSSNPSQGNGSEKSGLAAPSSPSS